MGIDSSVEESQFSSPLLVDCVEHVAPVEISAVLLFSFLRFARCVEGVSVVDTYESKFAKARFLTADVGIFSLLLFAASIAWPTNDVVRARALGPIF